jgi:hypothetical protein
MLDVSSVPNQMADLAGEVAGLLNIALPVGTSPAVGDLSNQISQIQSYRNFLVHATIEKQIDPDDDILMLREFLDYHNLEVPFPLDRYIDKGDIVEVYGEDFIQIYRNRTFFNFCSYDIYTILTNPFDVLFRRDTEITEKLIRRGVECLTTMKGIEPIGVSPHLLQEHYARNSKVFLINDKWISPVFSKVTGKVMGLLNTKRAKVHGASNVTGIGFMAN